MSVTLRDIAVRCGLSPSTVSDVLNNRARTWASEETRQRVCAAALELGYRPNAAASALRSGKTRAVGFVYTLPTPTSRAVFNGASEIIASCLAEQNYQLNLHVYPDQDQLMKGLQDLVRMRACDAFLLFDKEIHVAAQGAFLEQQGIPFVVKGRHEARFPHWAQIDYDHEGMMLQVVEHLVARGHRRIAYIGYKSEEVYAHHLLQGFRQAIQTCLGYTPPESLLGAVPGDGATEYMERWLSLPAEEQPSALAIGSGNATWREVEEALLRAGRVIGEGTGEFTVAGQATHELCLVFGQGHRFEDISYECIAENAVTKLLLPLLEGKVLGQTVRRILPELRPVESLNWRKYCSF